MLPISIEIGLRITRPPDDKEHRVRIADSQQISYDTRRGNQVIDALRSQGIPAYPAVLPSILLNSPRFSTENHDLVPISGISNHLIVYCNESGIWKTYHSDKYGFNNPANDLYIKDIDIALVGDSFMDGACVPYNEEIASHLIDAGHTVLNLGRGGNDPLFTLATLREYTTHIEPPIVVWGYYEGNDLLGLNTTKDHEILSKYFNGNFTQNLFYRQQEVDNVLMQFADNEIFIQQEQQQQSYLIKHELIQLMKLSELRLRLNLITASYNCPSSDVEQFLAILKMAKDEVAQWGGTLYFAYFPSWERYSNKIYGASCMLDKREKILEEIEKLDIPIMDVQQRFDAHKDPLSLFTFRLHGHYNGDGYKLVAQEIKAQLTLDK